MSALQTAVDKYRQAEAALDKNELETAESLLRELVFSEPNEPLFRWKLGYALSDLHQYPDAIREFEAALELDPKNVAALGGLGLAYMELGRWKEAEIAIRKRLEQKESPQHYVFLANILAQAGRYDEAIGACRKALDLNPTFAEAYLNIGLSHRHKGNVDEAIDAFKQAVRLDPAYSAAYRELGLTYYSRGEFKAARATLENCLKLAERDAWGHLYMALCLQQLNNDKYAAVHFKEAARLAPEIPFIQEKQREFAESVYK